MNTNDLNKKIESLEQQVKALRTQVFVREIEDKVNESEVKEHLIAEAKKRGFVEGLELSRVDAGKGCSYAGELDYGFWTYSLKYDKLTNSGARIYKQGVWATIEEDGLVIDGNKVEIDDDCVKVGCKWKLISLVKSLYTQINVFNSRVGCRITALTIDNSNEITVEQLKQIVDYIEKHEK